jgi:threonine synthase
VLPAHVQAALRARYAACRCDDVETLETIARVYRQTGRFIDPHTAVGVAAASRSADDALVRVVLATAHPAKFPDAVRRATGSAPPLPPRLAHLYEGVERVTVLANDRAEIRAFIEDRLSRS